MSLSDVHLSLSDVLIGGVGTFFLVTGYACGEAQGERGPGIGHEYSITMLVWPSELGGAIPVTVY